MEEMKKEIEKMKDQIKSLRLFYRVFSICFIVVTISFLIFYFRIQKSLSEVYQLFPLMHRVVQML